MTFLEHIQTCEQCRNNPFGDCVIGLSLLMLGDAPEGQPEREDDPPDAHTIINATFGKN